MLGLLTLPPHLGANRALDTFPSPTRVVVWQMVSIGAAICSECSCWTLVTILELYSLTSFSLMAKRRTFLSQFQGPGMGQHADSQQYSRKYSVDQWLLQPAVSLLHWDATACVWWKPLSQSEQATYMALAPIQWWANRRRQQEWWPSYTYMSPQCLALDTQIHTFIPACKTHEVIVGYGPDSIRMTVTVTEHLKP